MKFSLLLLFAAAALAGCKKTDEPTPAPDPLNRTPYVDTTPGTLAQDGEDYWLPKGIFYDSLYKLSRFFQDGSREIRFRLDDSKDGRSLVDTPASGSENTIEIVKLSPDGEVVVVPDRISIYNVNSSIPQGDGFTFNMFIFITMKLDLPLPSEPNPKRVEGTPVYAFSDKTGWGLQPTWRFETPKQELLYTETVFRVKTPDGYLPSDTFKAEYLYVRNDDERPYERPPVDVCCLTASYSRAGSYSYFGEMLTLQKVWFNGTLLWDIDRDKTWTDPYPEVIKSGAVKTYQSNISNWYK